MIKRSEIRDLFARGELTDEQIRIIEQANAAGEIEDDMTNQQRAGWFAPSANLPQQEEGEQQPVLPRRTSSAGNPNGPLRTVAPGEASWAFGSRRNPRPKQP